MEILILSSIAIVALVYVFRFFKKSTKAGCACKNGICKNSCSKCRE